jgi:sarcosine oxidase delta subunit
MLLNGLTGVSYRLLHVVRRLVHVFKFGRSGGAEIKLPTHRGGVTIIEGLQYVLYRRSGYKQPHPLLPGPFEELQKRLKLESKWPPRFVIHAGDQIYFDFPYSGRKAVPDEYRRAYRETWFEDKGLQAFLRACPQYMTLDDHELADAFPDVRKNGEVDDERVAAVAGAGTTAYAEYVHSRQPNNQSGRFYYSFDHGSAHFFVLDTRTERDHATGRLIHKDQMSALTTWLKKHRRELKFVVTSVPFVAELKPTDTSDGKRDERQDKWCGPRFRRQRDELIEFLLAEQIEQLVFLAGDMHCCYHARMRIGPPAERITIHELAGGPFYQLQFGSPEDFYLDYRDATAQGVDFHVWMSSFHGSASGALSIDVTPGVSPKVAWRIIRSSPRFEEAGLTEDARSPRDISGRIRF